MPGTPLVLPNIWDAASARAVQEAGFPAVATGSAAVCQVLGYEDGERVPAEEMLAAVARIARAVDVPVTADVERGYGLKPAELAERLLAAGGVGYKLAAGPGTPAAPGTRQEAGPSQGTGGTQDDAFQDDEATMGDAATDPGGGGDPAGTGDSDGGTSTGRDQGATRTGDGKKPTSPAKAPQSPAADNPADGPGGLVAGQCATSGC
ncbi:isocitrate lyase/phosphoenolpyruvate mutase family protein [Actinomadura sp. ATCC 31491]|uniref:Isocitrate lyase/phosphoenolpyruvate mutase family protein n=1 Tax=Actinomadura luzonensis TaxID=2805427 RepID=A0ABT0G5G8_9ACTN|nr:isocitrate lyase/phosphoenolpyruvate mutase family protein [Actinomadura luzonensis]